MEIVFLANNSNVSFIENEIKELCYNSNMERLILITEKPLNDKVLENNSKLTVVLYPENRCKIAGLSEFWILLGEVLKYKSRYNSFTAIRAALSNIRNEFRKAECIHDMKISDDAVFLSYWASSEALTLSLLKKNGLKNLMLTRMHAFDIYEDYTNNGSIPWRWFINKYLDRFIAISKHGENYYKTKYPALADKVSTHYLGIVHPENRNLNLYPQGKTRIVSCGWVGRRKNLNQIFYSLKDSQNMEWVHIGGGEEFDDLNELVQCGNSSLDVAFKGSLSTSEIMDYYNSESITCFVSLSKSEGLPVSMMEAMSFGIPVVSTDVGGCSEIVNENTGVLLPENYTDEDVRNAVKLCAAKFSSPEARKRIQDECKRKFDAKTNYGVFVDFMIEENRKHWEKMKRVKRILLF